MLRINNIRVQQQLKPLYRQGLFAIRYESTTSSAPTSTPSPVEGKPKDSNNKKATEKRVPLSQRLGGSGRGKILDNSDGKSSNDAFATFLLQEQKKQKARKENKQRRNIKERSEAKPGQFDDAVEDNVANKNQRKSQQANSNNNNNNSNNNNNNNKRQQRSRDRKGQRQNNKKSASGGSTSVPIRRATTFIDKDIDWTSLSSVDISKQSAEGEQKEGKDQELQLQQQLESENGDYSRFVSVGQSIQWSDSINKQALESLVIRNPSYNLDQKLVFLETVAKVSNVGTTVKK